MEEYYPRKSYLSSIYNRKGQNHLLTIKNNWQASSYTTENVNSIENKKMKSPKYK